MENGKLIHALAHTLTHAKNCRANVQTVGYHSKTNAIYLMLSIRNSPTIMMLLISVRIMAVVYWL